MAFWLITKPQMKDLMLANLDSPSKTTAFGIDLKFRGLGYVIQALLFKNI